MATKIPSSMLRVNVKITEGAHGDKPAVGNPGDPNYQPAQENVWVYNGAAINLDCTSKNLPGFGAPDIEDLAIDNPQYPTKMRFVGKGNLETISITALGDFQKWSDLMKIKKKAFHRVRVTFSNDENGVTQTVENCLIGQLSGLSGSNAPTFTMTLEPLGDKTNENDGEITNADKWFPQTIGVDD